MLVEEADDLFYVRDLSAPLTYVSRAAERLTGYRREEVLGCAGFTITFPAQGYAPRRQRWLAPRS